MCSKPNTDEAAFWQTSPPPSNYEWMSVKSDKKTLDLQKKIKKWLCKHFGDRCVDFCAGCEGCKRWQAFDILFGDIS